MYQPANGDHVTVTRRLPNGQTRTHTGIISGLNDGLNGFLLAEDGDLPRCMADAATMLRAHGVVQTIEPA